MSKGLEWTGSELRTLKRMWAAGASASQIARVLSGRSRGAVLSKIKRIGKTRKPPTIKVVGWRPGEIDRLKELWADDRTAEEIAALLGKPERTVERKLVGMGLMKAEAPERACGREWAQECDERFQEAMRRAVG